MRDHRRQVGPDHARRPWPCRRCAPRARPARPSRWRAWGRRRSCGWPRRRPRRRSSDERAGGRARCRPRRAPSAAARRSRRSSRRAPRRRERRAQPAVALAIARGVVVALRAGAGVGVAAVDDDGARAARRPRCSRDRRTGAAGQRLRVKTPAAAVGSSATTSATSGAPEALMPARRRPLPGSRAGRRDADGHSPCAVRPAPSSRPSIRFAFWMRLAGRALDEVVERRRRRSPCRCARRSRRRRGSVGAVQPAGVRRARAEADERLAGVARGVERVERRPGRAAAQAGVARDLEAAASGAAGAA